MYAAVSAACRLVRHALKRWWQTHEVVQLHGSDALVDARDNLLRNGRRINVFGVKTVMCEPHETNVGIRPLPIAESGDSRRDLIKLYAFLAPVSLEDEHRFCIGLDQARNGGWKWLEWRVWLARGVRIWLCENTQENARRTLRSDE